MNEEIMEVAQTEIAKEFFKLLCRFVSRLAETLERWDC